MRANGGGATKMKLMYKAYLSFNQLKEYLTFFAENGLIEYEEGMRTYRTTEKGMRLLQIQNTMDEISSRLFTSARNKIILAKVND